MCRSQFSSAPSRAPSTVSADAIRSALLEALQGKDLNLTSLSEVCEQVSQKLGFAPDALDGRKKEFKKITKAVVGLWRELLAGASSPFPVKLYLFFLWLCLGLGLLGHGPHERTRWPWSILAGVTLGSVPRFTKTPLWCNPST